MRYYKKINESSLCIGIGNGGEEITETEYNQILSVIQSKPTPPDGYGYRLKTDLTWEIYELPPMPPDDEDATEQDYIDALNELGVKTE